MRISIGKDSFLPLPLWEKQKEEKEKRDEAHRHHPHPMKKLERHHRTQKKVDLKMVPLTDTHIPLVMIGGGMVEIAMKRKSPNLQHPRLNDHQITIRRI